MADRYENLITHIADLIATDDYDQSQMLAEVYVAADEAGKEILDRAFICLCGYQLSTLMTQVDRGAVARSVER
jgi:hypothetical protein